VLLSVRVLLWFKYFFIQTPQTRHMIKKTIMY